MHKWRTISLLEMSYTYSFWYSKTVLSISVITLKMLDKTESIKCIASTSFLRYITEIKCDWMHTFSFKTEDLAGFNCSNKLRLGR